LKIISLRLRYLSRALLSPLVDSHVIPIHNGIGGQELKKRKWRIRFRKNETKVVVADWAARSSLQFALPPPHQ